MFAEVDILHLHISERGSFFRKALIINLGLAFGKKIILHHHGAEFLQFYERSQSGLKAYIKKIIKSVDMNLVLSDLLKREYDKCFHSKNIIVLYNAVEVDKEIKYNKKAKCITFFGRFGRRKGVYDLLDTIKILDTQLPQNIKFNLCGDGEINEVRKRIEILKIKHRIEDFGWTNDKDSVFQKTQIIVLPSYNEGLPMSILESMAYGIPCIASAVASIPEVIHNNENGLLIEPGNKKMLQNAICDLNNNYEKRVKMSEAAYRTIKRRFLLESHISKLESMYIDLMKEK